MARGGVWPFDHPNKVTVQASSPAAAARTRPDPVHRLTYRIAEGGKEVRRSSPAGVMREASPVWNFSPSPGTIAAENLYRLNPRVPSLRVVGLEEKQEEEQRILLLSAMGLDPKPDSTGSL